MLDEESAVPLYYQLQEIVRARIESGEFKSGQQLPPLSELCRDYGLSLGTVRQALDDLERQGLIFRRRGRGSFVAHPKGARELTSASSFSSYAKSVLGGELANALVSVDVVPASGPVAKKLEISEQTEVAAIRKVKVDEGQPFFLVTSYVMKSAFPGIESEDHSAGSLIDLLQSRYGLVVTRVNGWIEPILTSSFEAAILGVKKRSAAMLYERIRYSGSRPAVLSRHVIRGDKCRFAFRLEQDGAQISNG